MHRWFSCLVAAMVLVLHTAAAHAQQACEFSYPVGAGDTPAPLSNNHPVGGMNLPDFGTHLGADYWSGGGCADLGQPVYAVADGEIVEIVDDLGSYLDVVVIRHDVADVGNVYSMYGHTARDPGLSEGQMVTRRTQIGEIADVLAYFSPCHLHFELLNQSAFVNGPFCNGCANAGFNVSPGYDRQSGVQEGAHPATGDRYLHVLNDGIEDNWWFFADDFIDARVGAECGTPDFELTASSYSSRIDIDTNSADVELTIRNSGTLAWTGDSFRVATTDANDFLLDGADGYCNSPTDCRVFLGQDVNPDEEVVVSFQIHLPDERLGDTQAASTLRLEWTMVREGVEFFGPVEGADVTVCEFAGVERCDGVEPSGDAGPNVRPGPDAGSPDDSSDPFEPDDPDDPAADAGSQGGPSVIRGEGGCCATSPAQEPGSEVLLLLFSLVTMGRISRWASKEPA